MTSRLVRTILIALWAAAACMAQLDTGTLAGTVSDSSGGLIPGAKVAVQNMNTGATVELNADRSGSFVATALRPGLYRVTVKVDGFRAHVQEGIRLSVSDRLDLAITLQPGGVTEQVTVVGAAPVIDTASTTIGAVITGQEVLDLPLNGRAPDQLMGLAPGVTTGPDGRRVMSGQNQKLFTPGTKFLIDGGDSSQVDSDLVDRFYGSKARVSRISVDAIGEFRLVTSMYSAEYGQSLGGVMNFISKSGTNEFHGGLFEFFRNEKLDARDYFNVPPNKKPAFRLNQFGGSLGGPILRDKLFFFGNYEGVRQRLGQTFNTFVPTQAFRATLNPALRPVVDMLPLPNGPVSPSEPRIGQYIGNASEQLTEDSWMIKGDYQATAKDRLTLRHNYNKAFTVQIFGIGRGQFFPSDTLPMTSQLSYTRTMTPNVLNEAGFFVTRLTAERPQAGTEEVRNFPRVVIGQGVAPVGPGTLRDLLVGNTAFTFMDSLTWVKGAHQLKFGAQIIRMLANKQANLRETITYTSITNFANNQPQSLNAIFSPMTGMRITQNHFFAQDDIRVNRKLTVNAGIRYQYVTPPTEAHGRIANFDINTGRFDAPGTQVFPMPKDNWAPRIGLAYTPFGSQKTVLRMGYGIFYASMNPAEAQFLPQNVPNHAYEYNVVVPQQAPNLPGFPFPNISSFAGTVAPVSFNKDWKTAYNQQWNFNIQQAVVDSQTLLQVGYVGSRGVNLGRATSENLFDPGTRLRRFPQYGLISYNAGGSDSSYHSLQTTLRRRMTKGLAFNINYTWSHTRDQGGGNGQIPWAYDLEWASAGHDVRHMLTFSYNYQLPALPAAPAWLGSGWQINGITSMRTGFPVDPSTNRDPFGIGIVTARPNVVPGVSIRPADYDVPSNQYNIAAFSIPANGTWGNAGRNILRGPAGYNWDFSLFKRFRITENQQVEFRAEMFNLFNTPQFSNPGGAITTPANFGRSQSTNLAAGGFGSNRQVQFGLKYNF